LAYDWDTVADQWDALLDGICRSPSSRQRVAPSAAQFLRTVHGDDASQVSVTMIRREVGRLEASLTADALAADSVLSCPTAPPPLEMQRVRVPRERGLLCVATPDLEAFLRLRSIFPILHCFVPLPAGAEEPDAGEELADVAEFVVYLTPADIRYRLARSILLLDSERTLPCQLHEDAALFGVPALTGPAANAPSWPYARGGSATALVAAGRALLTNPVLMNRVSRESAEAARERITLDEAAIVESLREQHRRERRTPIAVGA
jgi:hypothetical protein